MIVGAISGATSELGLQATFTVTLATIPNPSPAAVSIPLSSANDAEVAVFPTALTFTSTNWNVAQTVTCTGVNDFVDDGDQTVAVTLGPSVSVEDPNYTNKQGSISVTNMDDTDTAGITVSLPSGPTSEPDGAANFTIVLDSQPLQNVQIPIRTDDPTEGLLLDPTSGGLVTSYTVVIQPAQWNVPTLVVVVGVDDTLADLEQPYNVVLGPTFSVDPLYDAMTVANVSLLNLNDDEAGVALSTPLGILYEAAGSGGTVLVSLHLLSKPLGDVSVPYFLSAGGATEATLTPGILSFTNVDYFVPQQVVIGSLDDLAYDGAVEVIFSVGPTASSDPTYDRNYVNLTLWNVGNDNAGISLLNSIGNTTEDGGIAEAVFQLSSKPSTNVFFPVTVYAYGEAVANVAELIFSPSNWNVPQTITLSGVNDNEQDGDKLAYLFVGGGESADCNYQGRYAGPFAFYNIDNDEVAIGVSPSGSLVTSEEGGTASFTVSLLTMPSADVHVALSSSNTAEGVLSANSITFPRTQWKVPIEVIVTGVDDTVLDGLVEFVIAIGPVTSADVSYAAVPTQTIAAFNVDNEDVSFLQVTTPQSSATTESGSSVSFYVLPKSDALLPITVFAISSDDTEGVVTTGAAIYFQQTPLKPQLVVVSGVDDVIDDGSVGYAVDLTTSLGAPTARSIGLQNLDDGDQAALNVAWLGSSPEPQEISEAGTAVGFSSSLGSQPLSPVTVAVSVSNAAEAAAEPQSLTFTDLTWNIPQTVVIRGVADGVTDGDQALFVNLGPSVSNDPRYHGLTSAALHLINRDVLSPSIDSLSPTVLPLEGGVVSIEGVGFFNGLEIFVGGVPLSPDNTTAGCGVTLNSGYSLFDSSHIVFRAPAREEGGYEVSVRNPDGSSAGWPELFYTSNCPAEGIYGIGIACQQCPTGGSCPGGNRIYPEAGYWSAGPESGRVTKCFPTERCLGGVDSACAASYSGYLCGSCAAEHYSEGILCRTCPTPAVTATRWIWFITFWLAFHFACFWFTDHLHAHVVWMLMLLSVVRAAGAAAGHGVSSFARYYYGLVAFLAMDFEFVMPGCAELSSNFVSVYYGNVFSLLIFLLALVVLIAAAWKGNWRSHGLHYKNRLVRSLISFALVTFWVIAKLTMQSVACINVGGSSYLIAQMSQRCFHGEHSAVAALSLPSWLYVVASPLVLAYCMYRFQDQLDRTVVTERFGVLYELLDLQTLWLPIIMQLIFIALSVGAFLLPRAPMVQFIVMELALVVFVVIMAHRPFAQPWQNWCSLVIGLASLLIVVVNFLAWDKFEFGSAFLSGLSVLAVLGSAGAMLAYVCFLLHYGRSQFKGRWSLANSIAYAHSKRQVAPQHSSNAVKPTAIAFTTATAASNVRELPSQPLPPIPKVKAKAAAYRLPNVQRADAKDKAQRPTPVDVDLEQYWRGVPVKGSEFSAISPGDGRNANARPLREDRNAAEQQSSSLQSDSSSDTSELERSPSASAASAQMEPAQAARYPPLESLQARGQLNIVKTNALLSNLQDNRSPP